MEKIIIEAKQPRALKKALASFFMFMMSTACYLIGMRVRITLIWLFGFMSTIFFFIAFIIYFGKTRVIKPLLTITFDGIIDSSTNSIGYIPYIDIKRFHIVTVGGRQVLGVEPKNVHSFINKLPPSIQQAASIRLEQMEHPLIIDVSNAKDISLEDIYTLLKKRLEDYRSLYD